MKTFKFTLIGVIAFALQSSGEDLNKLVNEMTYFYAAPSKERSDDIQLKADRSYNDLQKRKNGAELLTSVFIARASMKYHWDIVGDGKASAVAKEIVQGRSNLAKYVLDDTKVDLHKLDIWWSSFFATGSDEYLAKILRYAEWPPKRGATASQMMVPWAATWSFKSNCKQHAAVAAFAKECLEKDSFPAKNKLLKECVDAAKVRKSANH